MQTRVYGTIGPACSDIFTIGRMIDKGMCGLRFNLSHKSLEQSLEYIDNVRSAERLTGKKLEIIIDIEGPEQRIGNLNKPMHLSSGMSVTLGNKDTDIPVNDFILKQISVGNIILLDDGDMSLKVTKLSDDSVNCTVLSCGTLHSKKSITIEGCNLTAPALTTADYLNLELAVKIGVDSVMMPFVRSAGDVIAVRQALKEINAPQMKIYGKVENAEGIEKLDDYLLLLDELVIARGDLGANLPISYLPVVQKQLAAKCNAVNKPFMVVTQMLHSMIDSPRPTRAEVNDIANAVWDGAASVMLTGETAIGNYPVEAITTIVETVSFAWEYQKNA